MASGSGSGGSGAYSDGTEGGALDPAEATAANAWGGWAHPIQNIEDGWASFVNTFFGSPAQLAASVNAAAAQVGQAPVDTQTSVPSSTSMWIIFAVVALVLIILFVAIIGKEV